MKALELLQMAKKYNVHITNKMIDEAIEEIETLQQSMKAGMLNYDDCYSKLRGMDMLLQSKQDDWIEEIKTLQQELKQGQENYNKLWDMYSELKKENKELEEEIRNLTTELILNMLKDNK